ncbi:MAG: transcriptional repressor [Sulfurovum sp.]|nr:MAG: transcriptional repressor [Sulfurovum sp.]
MEQTIEAYENILEEFRKLIKSSNLKYTKQREFILEAIFYNKGHFTPEDIYNLILKKHPKSNIGIATVYRTLGFLENSNLVTSISFGTQGKKYEFGLGKHHDHLVCLSCGKIFEFHNETIERKQKEIAKEFNFKMTGHFMKITGICSECIEKMEGE